MEPIYIGVDFHSRQQTICYLKTETGELVITDLPHKDKEQVQAFYQQFQGQVIIGIEASGYSPWFETMLERLGHECWLGDATEIRRRARWRQKSDRLAHAPLPTEADQNTHHEQEQLASHRYASRTG